MACDDSSSRVHDETPDTITARAQPTLNAFQTSAWYSCFEDVTFRTQIVPLSESAVEFLESDGIWTHDVPDAVGNSFLSGLVALAGHSISLNAAMCAGSPSFG
jgi:hypothetical protein